MKESIFRTLSEIDVRSMVKKKGNFWYMSWSNAVREVSKYYPDFSWEFTEFEGLPYLETKLGYFVECSVTIKEVTRKQMMPVLDFKNQAHQKPTSADINKSQMRALAKAISLHGLGLELWAGEDLVGYDNVDSAAQKQETLDKLVDMYERNESPIVIKGFMLSFSQDEDLTKWVYSNFPKGKKTKVAAKIKEGQESLFDYKSIFEGDDFGAKQESLEELSQVEIAVISKFVGFDITQQQ